MDPFFATSLLSHAASGIAWLSAVAASIDDGLYNSMFLSTLASCAAIRLGPSRIRSACALPFAIALILSLGAAAFGRHEMLLLASMSCCPLLLWWNRPGPLDPMRELLLDSGPDPSATPRGPQ